MGKELEVGDILSRIGKGVDSERLAAAVIQQFGGEDGLAAEIFAAYRDAQGVSKQRLLAQVVDLVKFRAVRDEERGEDLSDRNDEELMALAQRYARKVVGE